MKFLTNVALAALISLIVVYPVVLYLAAILG